MLFENKTETKPKVSKWRVQESGNGSFFIERKRSVSSEWRRQIFYINPDGTFTHWGDYLFSYYSKNFATSFDTRCDALEMVADSIQLELDKNTIEERNKKEPEFDNISAIRAHLDKECSDEDRS